MKNILIALLLTLAITAPHTTVRAAFSESIVDATSTFSINLSAEEISSLSVATTSSLNVVKAEVKVEVAPVVTKALTPRELAVILVTEKFGKNHVAAFDKLIMKESSWNPNAINKSSGACGLVQALPCSKIGADKSPEAQLKWGLKYIEGRYGTPNNAWAFSQANGYY